MITKFIDFSFTYLFNIIDLTYLFNRRNTCICQTKLLLSKCGCNNSNQHLASNVLKETISTNDIWDEH